MKAEMLMYATSAVMYHDDVFIYNVIAGQPYWHLDFRATFDTPHCPTVLEGMTVKIGGKDPAEQSFFKYIKDTTRPMSGRLETNNEVSEGKYEKAYKHIMTIDVYDVNDPYLEIRAAEIHYNVIELNKTSPMFVSALNQN